MGEKGLIYCVPNGVERFGCSSWRNIIKEAVIAGEVTEINSLTALSLRLAAELTGDARYLAAADQIKAAVNENLWSGERYLLTRFEGSVNAQATGDMVFPLITGVADADKTAKTLSRLHESDFWTPRGLRTVPNSDPIYHPSRDFGLEGGSWPNLTLWYAAAVAPHDPDRALSALEMVAKPIVEPSSTETNVHHSEFPEFYDGDTGVNRGMHLSPWVAPTFIWSVMEGLLGLTWKDGEPQFHPHWPSAWREVKVTNLPCKTGLKDYTLVR